jgi:hypothetical protein
VADVPRNHDNGDSDQEVDEEDADVGERVAEVDDEVEAFWPGHKVNMRLVKKPDPAQPRRPYLVTAMFARDEWTKRFETREEAEAFIEETQARSERGFRESDRSLWD